MGLTAAIQVVVIAGAETHESDLRGMRFLLELRMVTARYCVPE
jgi:hypothetical protein